MATWAVIASIRSSRYMCSVRSRGLGEIRLGSLCAPVVMRRFETTCIGVWLMKREHWLATPTKQKHKGEQGILEVLAARSRRKRYDPDMKTHGAGDTTKRIPGRNRRERSHAHGYSGNSNKHNTRTHQFVFFSHHPTYGLEISRTLPVLQLRGLRLDCSPSHLPGTYRTVVSRVDFIQPSLCSSTSIEFMFTHAVLSTKRVYVYFSAKQIALERDSDKRGPTQDRAGDLLRYDTIEPRSICYETIGDILSGATRRSEKESFLLWPKGVFAQGTIEGGLHFLVIIRVFPGNQVPCLLRSAGVACGGCYSRTASIMKHIHKPSPTL